MAVFGFLKSIDLATNRRLKFGIHNFLNSRFITYPLTQGLLEPPFDTVFAPPAELAERLQKGELDMAFIPSIEYARMENLSIVPGFGIASMGEVKSVVVFSRYELDTIENIAVDSRSRTSVALLKILLKEYYKRDVNFIVAEQDASNIPENADAALLIGDETFDLNATDYNLFDLSKTWHEFTGKPFVFALLCVAEGIDADYAVAALERAKAISLEKIDEIIRSGALELEISEDVCRDYLTNCLRYDLNNEDIVGLKMFFQLAVKNGIAEKEPALNYYARFRS
ncbi:MAG: chorismate dehydratase [bacterium]|nr:MAG: chorismate dehydratase [bacterium]